jgi:hypothetical protein
VSSATNRVLWTLIFCIGACAVACSDVVYRDPLRNYVPPAFSDVDPVGESGEFEYCRLYRRKPTDDPGINAHFQRLRLQTGYRIGFQEFRAGYSNSRFLVSADHLSDPDDRAVYRSTGETLTLEDRFRFGNQQARVRLLLAKDLGFGLGWAHSDGDRLRFADLVAKPGSSEIGYDIQGNDGRIPFRWLGLGFRTGVSSPRQATGFRTVYLAPKTESGNFRNRIWSGAYFLEHHRSLSDVVEMGGGLGYTTFRANLRYRGDFYGKIDHWETYRASMWAGWRPHPTVTCFAGAKGFANRVRDDSYFDIWPFTFMDVFLDSRTRLKNADALSYSPFVRADWTEEFMFGVGACQVKAGVEYDHLIHSEDIVVKERYYTLFPFFFDYETTRYDFAGRIDGYFVLPLGLGVSWKAWRAECAVQQVIPVDWSDVNPRKATTHGPHKASTGESGGTWARLTVTAVF